MKQAADGTMRQVRFHDPRWSVFSNFLLDMGERPEGKTLDRIDPVGHYYKGNCRWATRKQQDYNKQTTVIYFAEAGHHSMAGSALEWAEFFTKWKGISMSAADFKTIMKFIDAGQLWRAYHPSLPSIQELRDTYTNEQNALNWKFRFRKRGYAAAHLAVPSNEELQKLRPDEDPTFVQWYAKMFSQDHDIQQEDRPFSQFGVVEEDDLEAEDAGQVENAEDLS